MQFFTYKKLDVFHTISRILSACGFLFFSTGVVMAQDAAKTPPTQFQSGDFTFDRFDDREGVVYLTKDNESYKISTRQLDREKPRPSIQVMSWASDLKEQLPLRVTLKCTAVVCSYRPVKNAQRQAINVLENGQYAWDFDWKKIDKIAQTKYPDDSFGYKDPIIPLNLKGADAENLYFVENTDPLEKKYVLKKNAAENISDSLIRASGSTSQDSRYEMSCSKNYTSECKKRVVVPKDGNDPYYEMIGLFALEDNSSRPQGTYDPTISIDASTLDKLKFQDMNDQYYIFNGIEKIAPSPKYPNEKQDMQVTYFVPKASVEMAADYGKKTGPAVRGFDTRAGLAEFLPPDLFAYWKAEAQDLQLASITCEDNCKQSLDKADDGSPIKYLTGKYILTVRFDNIDRLKVSYQKVTGKP